LRQREGKFKEAIKLFEELKKAKEIFEKITSEAWLKKIRDLVNNYLTIKCPSD